MRFGRVEEAATRRIVRTWFSTVEDLSAQISSSPIFSISPFGAPTSPRKQGDRSWRGKFLRTEIRACRYPRERETVRTPARKRLVDGFMMECIAELKERIRFTENRLPRHRRHDLPGGRVVSDIVRPMNNETTRASSIPGPVGPFSMWP